MNRMQSVALGIALLCGYARAEASEPLIFSTSAKIEVDANGTVIQVDPAADLSVELQDVVRLQVSSLRFMPPERDGKKSSGATYVSLGGCAIPDGESFRLSLDYKGNGPKLLSENGKLLPPKYPPAAVMNGYETNTVVTIIVGPDGHASLEGIKHLKGVGTRNARKIFDQTLTDWATQLRYAPEELAGQPVPTRLEIPVDFEFRTGGFNRSQMRKRLESSPECIAADRGQQGIQAVVVDSPIKPVPKG